jgi:rhamnose transport system permease protein
MLAAVFAASAVAEPRFLERQNLANLLSWTPMLLVAALGQMLVILSRGVDVSVGSSLGLSAMVAGLAFRESPGLSPLAGAGIAAMCGLALGCVNGLLIVAARVPPILATLGTLTAYRGLTFIVSKGEQIDSNHIPSSLASWSVDGPLAIGGVTISWSLTLALAIAAVAHIAITRWKAGRSLIALGGNEEAARLSGISVAKARFWAYALCGTLAGLAGVLYMTRFRVVNPATAGLGFELTVIAAVVIGGTNILGGSGTVFGVVLGCVMLSTIGVALAVLGVAATWQLAVYGSVILAALLIGRAVGERER